MIDLDLWEEEAKSARHLSFSSYVLALIAEIRALREVVEAARELAQYNDAYLEKTRTLDLYNAFETTESEYVVEIKKALKNLDEARRG